MFLLLSTTLVTRTQLDEIGNPLFTCTSRCWFVYYSSFLFWVNLYYLNHKWNPDKSGDLLGSGDWWILSLRVRKYSLDLHTSHTSLLLEPDLIIYSTTLHVQSLIFTICMRPRFKYLPIKARLWSDPDNVTFLTSAPNSNFFGNHFFGFVAFKVMIISAIARTVDR